MTNSPDDTYKKFYEDNLGWVDLYCRARYRQGWQSCARQWGETDEQGIYVQFYCMVDKLNYFISIYF